MDLYDEFGNLIALNDEDESSSSSSSEEEEHQPSGTMDIESTEDAEDEPNKADTVLSDNKSLVPLNLVYDNDTKISLNAQDTDASPLIQPEIRIPLVINEKRLPKLKYPRDYLLSIPCSRIKNVAIVGGINSGKTSFINMFIEDVHIDKIDEKYLDNHQIELLRRITIKSSIFRLLLSDFQRTYSISLIDSPGHINFLDEVAVAQRLSETTVVVIDIVEGVTKVDRIAIKNAIEHNQAVRIVLNKLDRLILELKLPVFDSYYKLKYVLEEVNSFINEDLKELLDGYSHDTRFSPELNNVCFASSKLKIVFTLNSFAKKYCDIYKMNIDYQKLAQRLWGDQIYFKDRKFQKGNTTKNSFMQFVLEPIYKIISVSIGKEASELEEILRESFRLTLNKSDYRLNADKLLVKIFHKLFDHTGFMDMLGRTNSAENNDILPKILDGKLIQNNNNLLCNVVKIVSNNDKSFAVAKIHSGILKAGDIVKILGPSYAIDNSDFINYEVTDLRIPCGRYDFEVNEVHFGSICLIGGDISRYINKQSTIIGENDTYPYCFKDVDYLDEPNFIVSIKASHPSNLPKLLGVLQTINQSYLNLRIENFNNEYLLHGTGEQYLDCVLYDLKFISQVDIKITQPYVKLMETVAEKSNVLVDVSSDLNNVVSIICEPLPTKIRINTELSKRALKQSLMVQGLDALESENFIYHKNDCVLIDETFHELEAEIIELLIQSFDWITNKGPICNERMSNIKFKVVDLNIRNFSKTDLLSVIRNAFYSSIMVAEPRLMEPIFEVNFICFKKSIESIKKLTNNRRGNIYDVKPIVGTQLFKMSGFVPILDSIGFETDIRIISKAMCFSKFDRYAVIDSDPMDKDLFIPKLKPASLNALSRDLMVKTRRRKNLKDDPELSDFVDESVIRKLKAKNLI